MRTSDDIMLHRLALAVSFGVGVCLAVMFVPILLAVWAVLGANALEVAVITVVAIGAVVWLGVAACLVVELSRGDAKRPEGANSI